MITSITEALAEVKTLGKRIQTKRQFVLEFLFRQERFKDPLEKDGGTVAAIQSARQSIVDLGNRIVVIRAAIQQANHRATLTIDGETRTVADWLTWRREVAPVAQQTVKEMQAKCGAARQEAQKVGVSVVSGDVRAGADTDVIINVNERDLAEEAEHLETVLGELDGKLSLLNATTTIEIN